MEQFASQNRQRQEQERVAPEAKPIAIPVTTVTNSNVTLWTVTADNYLFIEDIGVCNIAGAGITVTVYVVPEGGSAANGNKVYDAYAVLANDSGTLTALVGTMIEPGSFIVAVTSSATGANFWLSGFETVGAGRL